MHTLKDLLATYDIDGIGGNLIAATTVALGGAVLKLPRRLGPHLALNGPGSRSIPGYCLGWLLNAIGVPILLYPSTT